MAKKPQVGEIGWRDLTVKNAAKVRDFYTKVVGWQVSEVAMGDKKGAYADYGMHLPAARKGGKPGAMIAGVCHARGSNAKIPPQWMMYVNVKDIKASIAQAKKSGGKVVDGPRNMGPMQFCVVQDPAGAVIGLIES